MRNQNGQPVGDLQQIQALHISGSKSLNCYNRNNSIFCRGQNQGQNPSNRVVTGFGGQQNQVFPLRDLSVGEGVGCFVGANGCVRCWGSNQEGQRGNGNSDQHQNFHQSTEVSAFCGENPSLGDGLVTNVVVGMSHVCVSTANGVNVWCWGNTAQGQAGVHSQGVNRCTCPSQVRFDGVASSCHVDCRN
jgi:alpha-tubulin suppressor-like RCC1 family protein